MSGSVRSKYCIQSPQCAITSADDKRVSALYPRDRSSPRHSRHKRNNSHIGGLHADSGERDQHERKPVRGNREYCHRCRSDARVYYLHNSRETVRLLLGRAAARRRVHDTKPILWPRDRYRDRHADRLGLRSWVKSWIFNSGLFLETHMGWQQWRLADGPRLDSFSSSRALAAGSGTTCRLRQTPGISWGTSGRLRFLPLRRLAPRC